MFYIPVPGTEEGLRTFRSDNPFHRQHAAFGVMPHDVAAEEIGKFAFMLFTANGHESCPLFGTLPTSIGHEGNWGEDAMAPAFDGMLTRTLFKSAAHAVWPADMPATCEYLRRYKGDPWKRKAAEFDEGLMSVLIRQDGQPDAGFDEKLFGEWFELVTDPEHFQSERSNLSVHGRARSTSRRNNLTVEETRCQPARRGANCGANSVGPASKWLVLRS